LLSALPGPVFRLLNAHHSALEGPPKKEYLEGLLNRSFTGKCCT